MIGILGGMGPLATADFFNKLLGETAALRDEDNVPVLIQSDPRIPGRPLAILADGPSPLPALMAGRDRLIAAGATALAMPCNTAHHWYGELARDCRVPFINIIDVSCDALAAQLAPGSAVGMLATRATMAADLFGKPLAARDLRLMEPHADDLDNWLLPCIQHVKAGAVARAAPLLRQTVQSMMNRGVQAVLLACTELPIAWAAMDGTKPSILCIDTTRELARACVYYWRAHSLSS
ncbi:MAG: aspartate/glutamate racemase family protein [Proteobacteria bacterium]|nr:aspartate/glutamate racemase family protein [Pseudomonadota bacterium]